MISLKGHSIMALELPARRGGINRQRGKFFVRQPSSRGVLNFSAQALDQFGRTLAWLHWMAAQTRTITIAQRFIRRREKIDILAGRLLCCACGPAKDSGRAHSDKKYAFETRVPIHSARYIVSGGGRSSGVFMRVRFEKYNNRVSRC